MPTCNVNIDTINKTTNPATATYSDGGGPGAVNASGDVDFRGAPPGGLDIAWTLNTGDTFHTDGFSVTVDGTSEITGSGTLSNGNKTLTINDNDNDGLVYEYSLKLADNTVLDPKIYNRR